MRDSQQLKEKGVLLSEYRPGIGNYFRCHSSIDFNLSDHDGDEIG